MATRAEIITKVLRKLKVLPIGQTGNGEDIEIIGDHYDELHAFLTEREVITWSSTDDIPIEAVSAIVKLTTDAAADDFLGAGEEVRRGRIAVEAWGPDIENRNGGAFGDLQRLSAVDYVYQVTEADYY